MKPVIKPLTIATLSVFSLMATAASTAVALDDGWYAGASGDMTWMRHSNLGGGGNIDVGDQFNNFRLEGEIGYHEAGGDSGYSSNHYFTYMGNLYYDFNSMFPSSSSGWHVAPYIGAGLGDAQLHYGSSSLVNTFHDHSNNFAYEGMFGLNFVSSSAPNVEWSLGYRYLGTDSPNIDSSSIELGVKFHF